MNQSQWAEYEPFDRAGLTEWTAVGDCDEDGCKNRVAVYDPYGTCELVLCAEHNEGLAIAAPIYLAEPDDDDWDDDEYCTQNLDEEDYAIEQGWQRYRREQKLGKAWLGVWIGFGIGALVRRAIKADFR